MNRARDAVMFTWDFVVGDDWRTALGVVIAFALCAIVAGAGATAWWIVPVVAVGLLALSVWRAGHAGRG